MTTLRTLLQREVPTEWEKTLAAFSPPSERSQWLKLVWEPGHPWESPVERWIIYQMTPADAVDIEILEQLEHPLPPSQMGNYYDHVLGAFVNNPDCLITERAWRMYRETQCWGRPYWVIQGSNGGHKRWFSNVEKQFLKLAGLPPDAPPPGDLPYADFDNRVMLQLGKLDLMHHRQHSLLTRKQIMAGAQDAYTAAEERKFREELVKWLAEQVTEVADGVMESMMVLDAPRKDFDVKQMEEQSDRAMHNFIETGKSHGGLILAK